MTWIMKPLPPRLSRFFDFFNPIAGAFLAGGASIRVVDNARMGHLISVDSASMAYIAAFGLFVAVASQWWHWRKHSH